jgi:hypothetical protein
VIKTPMHDPASYDGMAEVHPLGRPSEISDVVDGFLYLERRRGSAPRPAPLALLEERPHAVVPPG